MRPKFAHKIKPYPIAYVPANKTDIGIRVQAYLRRVEAEAKAKARAEAEAAAAVEQEQAAKVRQIKKTRTA